MSNPTPQNDAQSKDEDEHPPVFVIEATGQTQWPDLAELWRYRHLARSLVERNLRVRFKNTGLGILWVILGPALQMSIYTVIFGIWARLPSGGVPYAVFVISGLVQVFFINAVISGATGAVRSNAGLSKKMHFPKLILPFVTISTALVDYFVALCLCFGIMFLFGVMPTTNMLFFPFILAMLLFMLLAIALLFTALGVRFADVSMITPSISMLIVYLSPVIYPITLVPEKYLLAYSILNPFAGYISAIKWSLAGVEPFYPWMLAISFCTSVVIFIVGIVYFVSTERRFNDFL